MRGSGAIDEQRRSADPLHQLRDEGVDRLDRHHDLQLGRGGAGSHGEEAEHGRHDKVQPKSHLHTLSRVSWAEKKSRSPNGDRPLVLADYVIISEPRNLVRGPATRNRQLLAPPIGRASRRSLRPPPTRSTPIKPWGSRLRAKNILAAVAVAAGLFASAVPALAHPHVWVTASATVLYDHGTITGLQQAWTFDEFYTQQAIEGLDKNGDGKYDRQELSELAQVNMDGLKEFDYFTVAKLGDADLKFKPPVDYWLEYNAQKIFSPCTSRCRWRSRSRRRRRASPSPSPTPAISSTSSWQKSTRSHLATARPRDAWRRSKIPPRRMRILRSSTRRSRTPSATRTVPPASAW